MGTFPFPLFPAFPSFTWTISIPFTLPHKACPEIIFPLCVVLSCKGYHPIAFYPRKPNIGFISNHEEIIQTPRISRVPSVECILAPDPLAPRRGFDGGCKLKYRLGFSIVCSFSGEHPDLSEWWPCETTLSDVLKYWPGGEVEPSEPFDSEYSYLAREGSLSREILDRLDDARGETRFQICRKLKEKFGSEAFWACISDVQMSGLFDRQTAFRFLDSIGAGFEDCGTMGTIGGPLGHWCPDFAFNVESQALISSIRITPILCTVSESGELEPVRPPSEWQWDRFKDLFKRFDCFDLARQGRAIDAH